MSDVIDSAPYRMRRPFRLRMSLSTAILLGVALSRPRWSVLRNVLGWVR